MTPGALLEAVAKVLRARELPGVEVARDRRGPRWLVVDGEVVAHVQREVLILRAVRDGIHHGEYVIPEAQHTPTGKPDEAHVIAHELHLRIVSRAAERAHLEAARRPAEPSWMPQLRALHTPTGGPLPEAPLPVEDDASCCAEVCAYQPQADTWPRYQVPAREDDRAAGLAFTELRADELTPEELADLTPEVRAAVDADLAAMDAVAGIGADDERGWRDHEHGGESAPLAAE